MIDDSKLEKAKSKKESDEIMKIVVRRGMIKLLKEFGILMIGLYFMVMGGLYFFQEKLVFFPSSKNILFFSEIFKNPFLSNLSV